MKLICKYTISISLKMNRASYLSLSRVDIFIYLNWINERTL